MPTSRRAVLIMMVVALVPAFAVTGVFVRADRRYLDSQVAAWTQQGARDLASGRADAAVDAYRTALARGSDDTAVRLQLAQALMAAGRTAEAESHLRTLWAATPGNGTVNVALARLAVESGRLDDAIRYYHAAIDGAWDRDPLAARRDTRFELARMLLQRRRPTEARSELIVLGDAVKDDPGQTLAVARLLVQAGDARTALTLARRVIAAEPDNVGALTFAADLQFRNAAYMEVLDLLQRASRRRALAVDAQSELRDAQDALALDPLAPRLGAVARQLRVRRVLMIARLRLDACMTTAGAQASQDAQALQDRLTAAEHTATANRRADADDVDEAMAVSTAVEQLPDTSCGPSSPDDRTLRLIARAHPAT